ncbi:MAG: hypothetical protein HZB15_04585 [Actinobacteria bacterium]|nr:hypothetical protein [Actinomycetota bacterium]
MLSASVNAAADGKTTVRVEVLSYASPLSDDWQLALTEIDWNLELTGDDTFDAYVGMIGLDDGVLAGVLDTDDQPKCEGAVPGYDASQRAYWVTFDTSCIGNPASFRWNVVMQFEDHDTQDQSLDTAPESGWAGPVMNDAYVPTCVPGTVAPPGPLTDGFASLVPARLLDTRPGQSTIDCQYNNLGRVGGTTEVQLAVRGRGGVPDNATAVALNVTATEATDGGFITVYPCGTQRPTTSNLNYVAGQTVANVVIAGVGTGGRVCMFSNASVHLVADVNGYFTNASSFTPLGPDRPYDSRVVRTSPLPAGSIVPVSVPGGGSSFVLNVTVTEPATAGFATVFPCGTERPTASNVNFRAGETVAHSAIAKAGSDGACIYLSTTAHLVIDSFGYFDAGAAFTTVQPARLLETRSGLSTVDNAYNATGLLDGPVTTVLPVVGRGNVPAGASAVVLNVTVDGARAAGFITVFPCDSPQPLASNVNYVTGSTVPNAVIVKLAANGTVCLYTNADTHLIVDVEGYFPAAP